jgi:DNA-binding CsgD family transcriptional regulator
VILLVREPTPRQVEVLATYVVTGSYKCAADELGIRYSTVRNHLVSLRIRLGVQTTPQAIYVMTARGLLVIPGVGRRVA